MSPIRPAAVPAILTLFSLGRSTMQRTLPIIAALLTLGVAPPVLGQCGTLTNVVTTSGYTDGNTSEDVDISCACAEFDSGNPDKLLMGCNGMDGDSQDIGLNSTGAELDYYVVCEEQTDGHLGHRMEGPRQLGRRHRVVGRRHELDGQRLPGEREVPSDRLVERLRRHQARARRRHEEQSGRARAKLLTGHRATPRARTPYSPATTGAPGPGRPRPPGQSAARSRPGRPHLFLAGPAQAATTNTCGASRTLMF